MPELPEVETIKIGARKCLVGKKIEDVEIKVPKLFFGNSKEIIGAKITGIERVAKILKIELNNSLELLIHLKMTGQLVYEPKGKKVIMSGGHFQKVYTGLLPHKHTHIIYFFSDGSKLYFNDLRKFGWNKVVSRIEAKKILSKEVYGPEPLTKEFNLNYLKNIFLRPERTIKDVLIDQKKLAGIGNIYSNDALYWAGILPNRKAKTLKLDEIKKLKKAIEKVFILGLKYGGSSENTYVDIKGRRGKYMDHSAVYKKKNDPKGHNLKREKQGSRSSYFCKICQK